eukprot:4996155-Karenia_brevis.AAC.1
MLQNKDELRKRNEEAKDSARKTHVEEEEDAQYAIDDASGRPLDVQKVTEARKTEMRYFKKIG